MAKEQIIRKIKDIIIAAAKPVISPINHRRFAQSRDYIKSLRGIHSGKRCFVIGNGPSLNAADLDKLKNEICFGANRIFDIYSKTDWRPTYYVSQDYNLYLKTHKEIPQKALCDKFVCMVDFLPYPYIKGAYYINMLQDFYPKPVEFSEDISKCIYNGMTVTYASIQLAVYMGFKEIYLLGIDHSYSVERDKNGKIIRNDDVKDDHFSARDKIATVPMIYRMEQAYETARKYADAYGIKIYNVTRGGKLEIFKRVDFDTLF